MFCRRSTPEPLYEVVAKIKPAGRVTNVRKPVTQPPRRWGPLSREAAEAVMIELAQRDEVTEATIEEIK